MQNIEIDNQMYNFEIEYYPLNFEVILYYENSFIHYLSLFYDYDKTTKPHPSPKYTVELYLAVNKIVNNLKDTDLLRERRDALEEVIAIIEDR